MSSAQFTIDRLYTKDLYVNGSQISHPALASLLTVSSNVGINNNDPKVKLDINGTDGLRIPVGNDGDRPTITDLSGVMRYNTTKNQYEAWALGGWQAFGGSKLELYTKEQGNNPTIKLTKIVNTYGGNNDGTSIEFDLRNQAGSHTYQAKIYAIDSSNDTGKGSLRFQTANGGSYQDRMTVYHDGSVGIGTTTPGYILDVSGTGAMRIPVGDKTARDALTGTNGLIRYNTIDNQFEGYGDGGWAGLGGVIDKDMDTKIEAEKNADEDKLRFTTAGTEKMIITDTGHVGIGTSDPSENVILDISSTGAIRVPVGNDSERPDDNVSMGCLRYNNQANQFEGYGNVAWGSLGGVSTPEGYTRIDSDNTNGLEFYTGPASANERMVIDSQGKVGIGTDSPGEKLTVNGSIQISGSSSATVTNESKIIFTRNVTDTDESENIAKIYTGNNVGPLVLESGRGNGYIKTIGNSAGNDPIFIATHYVDGERFRIGGNGNVGIGTTSPSEAKLHVNGYVTKSISGGRRIWAAATSVVTFTATNYNISIYASHDIRTPGSVFVSSDRRIKENIVDVSDNKALNMLREIPCRYYEYKDKFTKGNKKTIGFIAQEVKEVLPMAVATHPAIIPNELRLLENISWNGNKMSSTDLQDVSGIKYRFYVGNDISDNEKIVDLVGDEDNCFTFKQEWEIVYCYGKEVDDFHALDKAKLFALNFSATQEIDRIQQAEKVKLAAAEAKIASLETQLAAVLTRLDALESA
jgi:hypothetical protein